MHVRLTVRRRGRFRDRKSSFFHCSWESVDRLEIIRTRTERNQTERKKKTIRSRSFLVTAICRKTPIGRRIARSSPRRTATDLQRETKQLLHRRLSEQCRHRPTKLTSIFSVWISTTKRSKKTFVERVSRRHAVVLLSV